jgi:hypothetical protein
MSQRQFETYEELVEYLRHWRSWTGEGQYDFGGIVGLLAGCLDSLREFALEAELEDLGEYLEPEQKAFLLQLSARLADPGQPRPGL